MHAPAQDIWVTHCQRTQMCSSQDPCSENNNPFLRAFKKVTSGIQKALRPKESAPPSRTAK